MRRELEHDGSFLSNMTFKKFVAHRAEVLLYETKIQANDIMAGIGTAPIHFYSYASLEDFCHHEGILFRGEAGDTYREFFVGGPSDPDHLRKLAEKPGKAAVRDIEGV